MCLKQTGSTFVNIPADFPFKTFPAIGLEPGKKEHTRISCHDCKLF